MKTEKSTSISGTTGKNGMILVIGRIAYIALSMLVTVLVARVLGPERRGTLALYGSIWILGIQLFNFGVGTVAIYMISRSQLSSRLFRGSLRIWITVLLACALPASLLITYLIPDQDDLGGLASLLTVLIIPVAIAHMGWRGMLLGSGRFRSASLIEGITPIPVLLILLFLVLFIGDFGVRTAICFSLITPFLSLVMIWISIRKVIPSPRSWFVRRRYLFLITNMSVKVWLSRVGVVFGGRTSILVAGWLGVGASGLGYFAVALTIAEIASIFPTVFSEAYLSKIATRNTRVSPPHLIAIGFMSLLLLGALASIWLAAPFVSMIFGEEYMVTADITPIMLVGAAAVAGGGLYWTWMYATGQPWKMMIGTWLGGFTYLGCTLIFVPSYGVSGLVIAYLSSGVVFFAGVLITTLFHAGRMRNSELEVTP
jgi:O-antigen/teichoic acid export membrane protein